MVEPTPSCLRKKLGSKINSRRGYDSKKAVLLLAFHVPFRVKQERKPAQSLILHATYRHVMIA